MPFRDFPKRAIVLGLFLMDRVLAQLQPAPVSVGGVPERTGAPAVVDVS
jgi:hypothetical protein